MKGDFSRDTFDRRHRFARVLMQQGRVLLDADWNEQTSILLHYLRTLATDLIGPHGGTGGGFEIHFRNGLQCDFLIGWGRYYVDGILCENDPPRKGCGPGRDDGRVVNEAQGEEPAVGLRYTEQPDLPRPEVNDGERLKPGKSYLVYLDVWERHVTHLEADHICEIALGGPDTATRSRVVWQVKVAEVGKDVREESECSKLLRRLVTEPLAAGRPPCLKARSRVDEPSDDPCIIPPEARYRGPENQLYRVEIHDAGKAGDGDGGATFKWSRDNGTVVFGIRSLQAQTAVLDSLGPDEHRSLKEGDWVEVVDDRSVLRFEPRRLARVESVDRVAFKVTLASEIKLPDFNEKSTTHPLLRRWDQGCDVLPVEEGKWLPLEDGVEVKFKQGGTYRTADYWPIPARTAIGDVLWPSKEGEDGGPRALPPHGIVHHYAPLARIAVAVAESSESSADDYRRCLFEPPCAVTGPGDPGVETPVERREEQESIERRALTDIDGVGDTFAGRLSKEGIEDVAAVAGMRPAELAKVLTPPGGRKVPESVAASIIQNAKLLDAV